MTYEAEATVQRPRDVPAPADAVPADERAAARDRLVQRVQIFESLDKTSPRRSDLANEICTTALTALSDELYASRGVATSPQLRIVDALARVAPDAESPYQCQVTEQITSWIETPSAPELDERGLIAAHRLLVLLQETQSRVDPQPWIDLPRNSYPTSEMVGQLRAVVDIALTTESIEEIQAIAEALTAIAKGAPRGWIDVTNTGNLKESKLYRSPVRKCITAEGKRLRQWYLPQRSVVSETRVAFGEKSEQYRELAALRERLDAVAPAIREMCRALNLPAAEPRIKI
jgi:hypothetical protein